VPDLHVFDVRTYRGRLRPRCNAQIRPCRGPSRSPQLLASLEGLPVPDRLPTTTSLHAVLTCKCPRADTIPCLPAGPFNSTFSVTGCGTPGLDKLQSWQDGYLIGYAATQSDRSGAGFAAPSALALGTAGPLMAPIKCAQNTSGTHVRCSNRKFGKGAPHWGSAHTQTSGHGGRRYSLKSRLNSRVDSDLVDERVDIDGSRIGVVVVGDMLVPAPA